MSRRTKLFVAFVVAAVILGFIVAGDTIGGPEEGAITSECADGVLEASPAEVALVSEGQITFACEFEPHVPAFTVSGTNVKVIPHLSGFGSPYQSLWIYRVNGPPDTANSGACHERGGPARELHDGERLTIPGEKDWNYCAEYLDVGPDGLPEFHVTWETVEKFDVSTDIKPGRFPNTIELDDDDDDETVKVAILSTLDFDATAEVNEASLTFGRTGDEDSLEKCKSKHKDVNDDGLDDLVCKFRVQDTGFQLGDTEGVLKGNTVGGSPFEGTDSVVIEIDDDYDNDYDEESDEVEDDDDDEVEDEED